MPRRPPTNPQPTTKPRKEPTLALAVQGSFGHLVYAAGILEAFRVHNLNRPGEAINFRLASGCVEMMLPIWLYFGEKTGGSSLKAHLAAYFSDFPGSLKLLPTALDLPSWATFSQGVWRRGMDALATFATDVPMDARFNALRKWALSYWGLPGSFVFNRLFEKVKEHELQALMDQVAVPTFSNAMDASNFDEVYLYSGPVKADPRRLRGNKRHDGAKRRVEKMTPSLYFASGARPPTLAPIEAAADGKTLHWMEGAMRCNPPLNPLVDEGADHIFLLRFFPSTNGQPISNQSELDERFDDAIFSVPLDKELETIALVNRVVQSIRQHADDPVADRILGDIFNGDNDKKIVTVTDAALHSPTYRNFICDELDFFSHFEAGWRWETMFDRGQQIGQQLIADCFQNGRPNIQQTVERLV